MRHQRNIAFMGTNLAKNVPETMVLFSLKCHTSWPGSVCNLQSVMLFARSELRFPVKQSLSTGTVRETGQIAITLEWAEQISLMDFSASRGKPLLGYARKRDNPSPWQNDCHRRSS